MREKNYNTGLRGVLFEAQHYERMGAAIWLYGWLVLRQTHQHGSVGWVLGGAPISYREIEGETGFNSRTLERWMQTLRRHGYVETEAAPSGVIVRITKAKKFSQAGRNCAEHLRKVAGSGPRNCGPSERNPFSNERVAGQIGSSSVARSKEGGERDSDGDFHKHFHRSSPTSQTPNPSGLGQTPEPTPNQLQKPKSESRPSEQPCRQQDLYLEMRLQQQLLRAEREEAVRRELAVGTGPEVRRP